MFCTRSPVVRVPMAVRRIPIKKRRGHRHSGHQTTMGLYPQNGRRSEEIVAERHVSTPFRGRLVTAKST